MTAPCICDLMSDPSVLARGARRTLAMRFYGRNPEADWRIMQVQACFADDLLTFVHARLKSIRYSVIVVVSSPREQAVSLDRLITSGLPSSL